MFNIENLEEAFKNNIDVAEKSLRNIGIDVKDEEGNYKSLLHVLSEVSQTFEYINAKNIVITSVIQNMVGIRYFNHAILLIEEMNEMKNRFKFIKPDTSYDENETMVLLKKLKKVSDKLDLAFTNKETLSGFECVKIVDVFAEIEEYLNENNKQV